MEKTNLAYLVGRIMGDGHLDKRGSLKFISGSRADSVSLRGFINKTCGVPFHRMHIRRRSNRGTSFSLDVNSVKLGRKLFQLGAPMGNKVKQSFFVPQWIQENQSFKKMFLRAILEDELSTIKIEKRNHSIQPKFKIAKQEHLVDELRIFLQQVRSCIESFGVECSNVSKDPKGRVGQRTKDLYFHIKRSKMNIIKFEEEIGFFLNKEKKMKLKECCEILRKTLQPKVDRQRILSLKEQGLTIRQIADRIHHGRTTVHRILTEQQSLNKKL